MPWTVLEGLEALRRRARETADRIPGACHDSIASIVVQSSSLLRRRGTEDMAAVAALITGSPHCVPCIVLLTDLDARRVYAALERLKADVNLHLLSGTCARCQRTTTVHVLQS